MARCCLAEPWRRRGRRRLRIRLSMISIFRCQLVAVEYQTAAPRRLIARRGGCGRLQYGSRRVQRDVKTNVGAKPLGDVPQLAHQNPKAPYDQPGARGDSPRKDQGITETELLNRDTETDRQETGQ